MRVLNTSFIVLFATVSSLALTGCLGTNTPPSPGASINLSTTGTVYGTIRGAGFEDAVITSTGAGVNGATIGTDLTGASFTSTGALAGFTLSLPADASTSGSSPNTVTLTNADFTNSTQAVFPTNTKEGTVITTGADHILIDKFGTSQDLKDSEYGMWLEPAPISNTGGSTNAAVFAFGIPTTIMPTGGVATYTGGAAGVAATTAGGGEFSGTANMTANFAVGGGTISGTVSDIKFSSASSGIGAVTGTMNDIVLGGGTISGNNFTGSTVSTAAPTGTAGATNLDISTATGGKFGGTFNGPSAAEVSGTFQVTGGAANVAVIGSFGAKK